MSQVTEQSVRFQTALASIKLIQASAVLDLTEDDFDFLTSNKVWIATRSEERRVGKECRSRWSAYHQKKKLVLHSAPDRMRRMSTTCGRWFSATARHNFWVRRAALARRAAPCSLRPSGPRQSPYAVCSLP